MRARGTAGVRGWMILPRHPLLRPSRRIITPGFPAGHLSVLALLLRSVPLACRSDRNARLAWQGWRYDPSVVAYRPYLARSCSALARQAAASSGNPVEAAWRGGRRSGAERGRGRLGRGGWCGGTAVAAAGPAAGAGAAAAGMARRGPAGPVTSPAGLLLAGAAPGLLLLGSLTGLLPVRLRAR